MIEVGHTTDFVGLQQLGRLKGLGNGDRLTLPDGSEWGPGTLIFVGFVAPPTETDKLTGVLRFKPGESMEAHRAPFSKFIQPGADVSTVTPTREEPTDDERISDETT